MPANAWEDQRLVKSIFKIDNKTRFLKAAGCLFEKLRLYIDSNSTPDNLDKDRQILIQDISHAIGEQDLKNTHKNDRILRYKRLSIRSEYGGASLRKYDEKEWINDAIKGVFGKLHNRVRLFLSKFSLFKKIYRWKDIKNYKETNWYKFQEAVRAHQKEAFDILSETTFSKMEMELEKW
jgi:hypothetical protein